MLSRIAESLFWIGRYLERAEDTARILDVHLQQLVEDPTVDEELSSGALLGVMGLDVASLAAHGPLDLDRTLEVLCFDPNSWSSIRFALAGARESARGARETVSVELWEAINTTHLDVASKRFQGRRPTAALAFVRDRCALIGGLADQTMSHDEGWQFLRLGRALERIDMTARLLASASLNQSTDLAWANVLRSCGGHHAFLRVRGGGGFAQDAPEFLLQDELFPRSLVHSLGVAEDALLELDGSRHRGAIVDRASQLIGRARADLQFTTPEQLTRGLPERMEKMQVVVRDASDAVAKRYFEGADAAMWEGGQL